MKDFNGNELTFVDIRPEVVLAGRFRLVRRIGRGGMGEVWLAEDRVLDQQPVALKMLKPELAEDAAAIQNLKREVVVTRELRHPNIVGVFEFHQHGDLCFIAMEFVQGRSLAERLVEHSGPFRLEEVLPWAEQVAQALDYAHSRNVLHRDAKPGNMLLADDGTVKLVDFGIARLAKDTETRRTGHATSGTLAYMSPQQLMDEKAHRNDPRNDVYSFAASLYELLRGDPPFTGGDISMQILRKTIETVEGMPDYVNAALLAGMAKEIEERPATCAAMLREFSGQAAELRRREQVQQRAREEEARARREEEARTRREEEGRRQSVEAEARRQVAEILPGITTQPWLPSEKVGPPEKRRAASILAGILGTLAVLACLLWLLLPQSSTPMPPARPRVETVQDRAEAAEAAEARRKAEEDEAIRRAAEEWEQGEQAAEALRREQERQEWETLKAKVKERSKEALGEATEQVSGENNASQEVYYYEEPWDFGAAAASAAEWARRKRLEEEAERQREVARINAERAELDRAAAEHERQMQLQYQRFRR